MADKPPPPLLADDDPRLVQARAWLTQARERLTEIDVTPSGHAPGHQQVWQAIGDQSNATASFPADAVRAGYRRWVQENHPEMNAMDADYAFAHALEQLAGSDNPTAVERPTARTLLARQMGLPAPPPTTQPRPQSQPVAAPADAQIDAALEAVRTTLATADPTPPQTQPASATTRPVPQRLAIARKKRRYAREQLQEKKRLKGTST